MRPRIIPFMLTAAFVVQAGCATVAGSHVPQAASMPPGSPPPAESATTGSAPPRTCDRDRDRAAILAMTGEFDVTFSFAEDVALAPGYKLHDPYRTAGSELVMVVEDTTNRISLQHLLMIGKEAPQVIKHWRQDWSFEDPDLLEYQGGDTWQKRRLPAGDVACAWTQAVFEVTDGPRYESWGRWVHAHGSSWWTSQETWRPLPRREYTHRDDYDVLVGVNRHAITPEGWVHEQDNTKLVLRHEDRVLAREHGVNRYVRATGRDFGPARRYWQRSSEFWRDVRGAWSDVIAGNQRLSLRSEPGGKPLHDELTEIGGAGTITARAGGPDRQRRIAEIISRHLDGGGVRRPF